MDIHLVPLMINFMFRKNIALRTQIPKKYHSLHHFAKIDTMSEELPGLIPL